MTAYEMEPIVLYDPRLRKTTLRSDDKKIIIDVYNSLEYELVPCAKVGKVDVAHPYVLCRFFLIDYWLSVLLKQPNRKLLEIVDKLSSKTTPVENFRGTYVNEMIALKKMHQEQAFMTYYPKKYHDKHGAYRKIS